MTPRENFEAAMARKGPEWVPLDMGKHIGSIHRLQYPRLAPLLPEVPLSERPPILDRMAQTVVPDEALLRRLHIDFRWIVPHWVQVRERTDRPGYVDMWGVPYRAAEGEDHYAVDGALAPLRQATIDDIDRHAWPDTEDPAQFAGLAERARDLYHGTGYVLGADAIKAGPLMSALQIRGYEQFFMDLIADPAFADRLLGRITDLLKRMWTRYLEAVGPYVQIAYVTDDLGTQTSLLMSPKLYRARIKPYHADLHAHIKSLAKVKLMIHTDGAVGPLINDLIETGADILNPVQTSTAGMGDTAALKAKFGGRLAFHGAIDVQQLMPNASLDQIRWEIARRMTDLGSDGGYILAPCHNIGHDIPPESAIALFDMAHEMGRYPLDHGAVLAKGQGYFDSLGVPT